jgi:CMP-N-acetylneuraminic acid synthetase
MYTIVDNVLKPIFKEINGIREPYDGPRQNFPENIIDYYTEEQKRSERYMHNGYIDIFNATIVATGSVSGEIIYPYIMKSTDNIDIDTEETWREAELRGIIEGVY